MKAEISLFLCIRTKIKLILRQFRSRGRILSLKRRKRGNGPGEESKTGGIHLSARKEWIFRGEYKLHSNKVHSESDKY